MVLTELEIKHLENIMFLAKKAKMPDITGEAALIWSESMNFVWAEIEQNRKELQAVQK